MRFDAPRRSSTRAAARLFSTTAFAILLCALTSPAFALTVVGAPAGKGQTNTTIFHGANSTVTFSVGHATTPLGANPPPAPAGIPTFTWNLYDSDIFGREQNAVDFNQTAATAPPGGWVHRNASPKSLAYNCCWEYVFTALPALTLNATDPAGQPDPWVETVGTLGATTKTHNVCTPDLPAVSQGDLGVRQLPNSYTPRSNSTGTSHLPLKAFSRGFDEISTLLFSVTPEAGLFFSVDEYSGSLPASAADLGPLLVFTAPPDGAVCFDEAASSFGLDTDVSYFNMNTGEPGSGIATDEFYFVRDMETAIEYSAAGDVDVTSIFFDLDDQTGRCVTALTVEDNGIRGVFEPGDYLVYAYEGSPELWVLEGPQGDPYPLEANGISFDGSATLDFSHFADDGTVGPQVVPTGSITGLSIASNRANVQPQPTDRVWSDYDPEIAPEFFDGFETGSVALFRNTVGSGFDYDLDEGALGGRREIVLDVTSSDGTGVFVSTFGGSYTHDQSFDTFARSEATWGGEIPLGLDLDTDPSNAFVIAIEQMENIEGSAALPRIGAYVEREGASGARDELTWAFEGPSVANEYLVLPYQLFGPDLGALASVGLVVDGRQAANFFARIAGVTTTTVDTFPPIVDAFDRSELTVSRSTAGTSFATARDPLTMTGEIEVEGTIVLTEGIGALDIATVDGDLRWAQGPQVLASGSLVWDGLEDGAGTDFGSAVDLTALEHDALAVTVESLRFDGGVAGGVGLSFGIASRANPEELFVSPTQQLTEPIEAGQTLVFPFAAFSGELTGMPTIEMLSETASLSLWIDGGAQSDFELVLGEVRTVVPEPGFAGAMVFGGLVLGLLHRGRTRRRA